MGWFVRCDISVFSVIQQRTPLCSVAIDYHKQYTLIMFAVVTGGTVAVTLSIIERFRVRRCLLTLLHLPHRKVCLIYIFHCVKYSYNRPSVILSVICSFFIATTLTIVQIFIVERPATV